MDNQNELSVANLNGIASRIALVAETVGGKRRLAELIQVSESQIHRYSAKDSDPKISVLLSMAAVSGVRLHWLITGEEPVLCQEGSDGPVSIEQEFALIPGYNVHVSAGNGTLPLDEQPARRLAFRHRWLQYRGLNAKNLVMVYARGDSMEPTIADNDTLMVDTSDTVPQDGQIFVIRNDGHLLVKRTQVAPGQGVWLLSDNANYDRLLLNLNDTPDLDVIGRVVWIGKNV
ncbi:transcriptional regulator [Bacterioplanes sanyensis]|uniref:Transcriptional regulator n=1 Tax=Bacterioplanes sanyensis TaxID=1249553 RepID=A0A222FGK0_9GAMM|nr:S24 family peptidase [Bacterioplanes sanyensis]ASP37869.1 transcriptional regulator [Bacterioplanes sanyensis]